MIWLPIWGIWRLYRPTHFQGTIMEKNLSLGPSWAAEASGLNTCGSNCALKKADSWAICLRFCQPNVLTCKQCQQAQQGCKPCYHVSMSEKRPNGWTFKLKIGHCASDGDDGSSRKESGIFRNNFRNSLMGIFQNTEITELKKTQNCF